MLLASSGATPSYPQQERVPMQPMDGYSAY